jgi:hypothetical protein
VDDFEARWFAGQWRAAGEPSLYRQSLEVQTEGMTTYRFTWLRTFHAPMFIRIDVSTDGRMRMTAKRLSGKGGYAPGHVDARIVRTLGVEEIERVKQVLAANDTADLPPIDCQIGVDGAQWIFETSAKGAYHFVNRFTPGDGEVRKIGEAFLGLTDWNTSPIY